MPIAILTGALLGLFLSRFWYELDPVRFARLGDWPGTIGLAVAAAIFLTAQWWLALRRVFAPDAILSLHIPFALLLVYVMWPDVDLRLAAIVLLASTGLAVALGLRVLASPPPRLDGRGGGEALALAMIVFALYVRTLGTHVGQADTFEFQVVAPTLGIAHPTGYPLYVLAGKLFSLLPIGSIAFRVNLTSAVFATAAAVVAYALIVRLTGRPLVAFIAALAFAASKVVWSQAVVAEVYALNALIAGMVIGLSIDLIRKPRPRTAFPGDGIAVVRTGGNSSAGEVCALFLLLGLGISHHLTTILLLPACALTIVIARPRLPIRTALIALGLFLLGLALWLYVPLRWPALHGGVPMTLNEFVDWITGVRFGGAFAWSAWSDPTRWTIVARFLLEAFGPAGAGLALVGAIRLVFRHRRAALITIVTFAAYAFYGLVYLVPDVSVFLIPAYLIAAIWIGVGVAVLVDALTSRIAIRAAPLLYASALTLFMLIPIFLLVDNFSVVDRHGEGAPAEAWGRYVLSLPIPDGAALLVDSEKIAPLYYLQVTEKTRPDLEILVLGTEQEYRQQLDTRLAQGQPVYLARFLPNIPYPMRSLGPLVEVSNRRINESANQVDRVKFGDVIELTNVLVEEGNPARVTLHWRALTDVRPNYYVRLRLVDERGRVWWEDSGAHPVGGYYPTGAWAKDEAVADYHEITFDPAFPPDTYILQVGLFPPFRNDGLATDSGDAWWSVAPLIAPQATAPPLDRVMRQTYGEEIVVTGAASIGVVPRLSEEYIRLNWARIEEIGDRQMRVRLSLVDAAGQVVWSNAVEPYSGVLSVKDWPPGSLQTVLEFHTPDRDGSYALRLAFADASGTLLATRCNWLAPASLDCLVAMLEVAGEAIGDAINFDNQVLLTAWSIDRTEVRPGETIDVRLTWRGLKPWADEYTVTVQLIGPDGKLHGQVDAWPVQGTLPTSAWAAGQVVDDPYAVTLQPDAPSGRYQVAVGWYLLATLRRLPVLGADGRPLDDHVIIGEFDAP